MNDAFYRYFDCINNAFDAESKFVIRLSSVLYSLKAYKFSDNSMMTSRCSPLFYIKNK